MFLWMIRHPQDFTARCIIGDRHLDGIKDGKSTLVLDAMVLGGIPNGVALSPDEKYLYANAGQRMFRYEVKPDGSLGPGAPFTQGPGIGDGMKVDTLGNV
ncbi:MAG: hypothetical protein AAB288_06165, partial [Acidobacteriota bacterium]